MTSHSQTGRNLTHFWPRLGTPLSDVNSAVDGGALLLAPTTTDANDAIHQGWSSIRDCICCSIACIICRQQIDQVEFEPRCC